MKLTRRITILFLTLLLIPGSGLAHHSFVGFYDQSQIIEIEGLVTAISWRNPHASIRLDVTDESGQTVEWQIETGSISVLRVRGVTPEFLKIGDQVKIAGEPSLKTSTGLYARNMLLESGDEVMLSIGIAPRWTDSGDSELIEPEFDTAVAREARQNADGIFRVWTTVLDDPNSFPLFKGGYPLTQSAQVLKSQWDASDIVQLGCEPKGMPSLMITPYPFEFVQQGEDILIRFEEDNAQRFIHMSATDELTPTTPSLLGYSIGNWEGETLMVETSGVSAEYLDYEGTPQSEEARFIERFTVNNDGSRLDYHIRIIDPTNFTEEFELTRYLIWQPALLVNPYDCLVTE
jgi:hypothetical protein